MGLHPPNLIDSRALTLGEVSPKDGSLFLRGGSGGGAVKGDGVGGWEGTTVGDWVDDAAKAGIEKLLGRVPRSVDEK